MNIAYYIISFIICYLIGSIPSGLIIGKSFKGIDIRQHGSGNLGGTNAIRTLGKTLGTMVAVMDVLKGSIAFLLAKYVFIDMFTIEIPAILFGITAVVGHIFPIFANFKGGKAVATSGGVILFASWPIFLIGIITFIITLKISKIVSLSSTVVAFTILVASIIAYAFKEITFFKIFNSDLNLILTIFILFSFVVIRHIPNYKRIIAGTERKIGQKKI